MSRFWDYFRDIVAGLLWRWCRDFSCRDKSPSRIVTMLNDNRSSEKEMQHLSVECMTGDVMDNKQMMKKYGMIDSVKGGTQVKKGQTGHVFTVSHHYYVRQNTGNNYFCRVMVAVSRLHSGSVLIYDRWALRHTNTSFSSSLEIWGRFEIGW